MAGLDKHYLYQKFQHEYLLFVVYLKTNKTQNYTIQKRHLRGLNCLKSQSFPPHPHTPAVFGLRTFALLRKAQVLRIRSSLRELFSNFGLQGGHQNVSSLTNFFLLPTALLFQERERMEKRRLELRSAKCQLISECLYDF